MNSTLILGKIVDILPETKDNSFHVRVLLEVKDEFRNQNGDFEFRIIPVYLWQGIGQSFLKYHLKGEYVIVKGRISSSNYTDSESGETYYKTYLIGEKVESLPMNTTQ